MQAATVGELRRQTVDVRNFAKETINVQGIVNAEAKGKTVFNFDPDADDTPPRSLAIITVDLKTNLNAVFQKGQQYDRMQPEAHVSLVTHWQKQAIGNHREYPHDLLFLISPLQLVLQLESIS